MAIMRVNPTRMELTRLKKRVKVARRGHKLLKDKRDELMKQFLDMVKKNRDLRRTAEEKIARMHKKFLLARAVMPSEIMGEAIMVPKYSARVKVSSRNIMSVEVPDFDLEQTVMEGRNMYPFGFAETSGELDKAVSSMYEILPGMIELAELEKSVQLLADEIEKTRRRVNALEYVLIPQLEETIKYITMKLDENERGNLSRLMKVKDMMIEQAYAAKND